jgi:hypothetical protein
MRQAGTNWVAPDEARERLDERDRRMAADTRTQAEILLGDPPAHRSALATKTN